jgi:hypothetical protein
VKLFKIFIMAGILLTNLAGYTGPGVRLDESGINIQSLTVKVAGTSEEILDRQGRIVGLLTSKIKTSYVLKGYVAGASGSGAPTYVGVMAADVGEILTIASVSALGGMSGTGACVLRDIELSETTGKMNEVTLNVDQYNDVPSTATTVIL